MSGNEHWVCCENCGKKLIKRKENGIFVFKFGRTKDKQECLVEIEVFGNIKIKCFRDECRYENILNLFPGNFPS